MGHRADYEDRIARERRWRNQMLTGLAGRYRMVIGASALHLLHARFPDVIRDQTGHLLRMIDEGRVAMRLLPASGCPAALQHGFIVLRHLPQQTDQAYLQQHTGWVAVPDLATHLVAMWNRAWSIALSVADTQAHLKHMHETGGMSGFGPAGEGLSTRTT